jgi:Holliday junction DNA helicase RuvA
MIARLEGKLVKLNTESALVQVGAVGYEVLLPGYCISALAGSIGSSITLCTMEYYEGSFGGNLIPRIVGFLSDGEREFFGKFTSVKGIGVRKALRSLTIPIASIASAIENGDDKTLTALDGIGKRTAQQIIAELKGKLGRFAIGVGPTGVAVPAFKPYQAETLEILIAWGEKRNEAMELIELACKKHPDVKAAEELVPLVYRVKQGIEA